MTSVLDSTGKTPDGILSDVTYFCDFMNDWVQPGFCNQLQLDEEQRDLINFAIPRGNTIAMGSFEGKTHCVPYSR